MVLTDELSYAHSHQVLHVSFSHNGRMFATCSKDGFVHVSSPIDCVPMQEFKMRHTILQCSFFFRFY